MAQLVISSAPYRLWPGGIISLRASDWLGSSGATTEADSRSIEGTVVRETQTTASVIRTAGATAFANADDTLTIDMTGITVSTSLDYAVFCSVLIEGDWDDTVIESRRQSTPYDFTYTTRLAIYGDAGHPNEADFFGLMYYPRLSPHYRMIQMLSELDFNAQGETLHVRAYSYVNSTTEWLIDQIVLVPYFPSNSQNAAPAYALNAVTTLVDGADGGDDNGKFTWHPHQNAQEPATNYPGGSDGGGDYQKDDSEYVVQLEIGDSVFFDSGGTTFAAAYSINGPYFKEDETIVSDTFTRSHGATWGEAGNGYFWELGTPQNVTYSVTGTEARMHFGGVLPRDSGLGGASIMGALVPNTSWTYAALRIENFIYSGQFRVDATGPFWDGSSGEQILTLGISAHDPATDQSGGGNDPGIKFDIKNETWQLRLWDFNLSGSVSVASWWGLGVDTGFKIEVRRHVIRAKVWELSGGEPGTWDFEGFIPIHGWPFPASSTAYPYSDDVGGSSQRYENFSVAVRARGVDYVTQWDVYVDNVVVAYDGGGSEAETNALMEQDGDEISRIEIPLGAQHWVYWGVREWAELDGFGDPYIVFSSKVWSDPAAAELQRAEVPFWWFREAEPFRIVSMNWRIADRTGVATRVLVGE